MIRKEIKDNFQNADLISSQSRYDRFDTPAYLVLLCGRRVALMPTQYIKVYQISRAMSIGGVVVIQATECSNRSKQSRQPPTTNRHSLYHARLNHFLQNSLMIPTMMAAGIRIWISRASKVESSVVVRISVPKIMRLTMRHSQINTITAMIASKILMIVSLSIFTSLYPFAA